MPQGIFIIRIDHKNYDYVQNIDLCPVVLPVVRLGIFVPIILLIISLRCKIIVRYYCKIFFRTTLSVEEYIPVRADCFFL